MAAAGMEHWKVTMLGDGGVGKTALAVQFTQKQFIETYDPTIEDSYRKQVFVDGKMSFLEIIDTAGQEDYSTLREQWIREGQGFILVYSVTNQISFQNIDRFRRTMISLHSELPQFLIIGNKADDAYRREVSAEQGLTYARRHNCEFFEASAKTGQNVDKLFSEVVRQLRASSRVPQPLTPNSTTSNGRGSSRTSASGLTGTGSATPLTVPSSGSLPHAGSIRSGGAFSPPNLSSPAPPGGRKGSLPPQQQMQQITTMPMHATGTSRGRGGAMNGRGGGGGDVGPSAYGQSRSGSAPGPSRLQVNTNMTAGPSGSGGNNGGRSGGGVGRFGKSSGGSKDKAKEKKDKSGGGCVIM